jgi:hypothetical protein
MCDSNRGKHKHYTPTTPTELRLNVYHSALSMHKNGIFASFLVLFLYGWQSKLDFSDCADLPNETSRATASLMQSYPNVGGRTVIFRNSEALP